MEKSIQSSKIIDLNIYLENSKYYKRDANRQNDNAHKIFVLYVEQVEDAKIIIDYAKNNDLVVVNFEKLDNKEVDLRIKDILKGARFALEAEYCSVNDKLILFGSFSIAHQSYVECC